MPRDLFGDNERPMRSPTDPDAYWPVRLGKDLLDSAADAFTYPSDVMKGEQPTVGRNLNLATFGLGANPGIKAGDRAIPGMGLATKEGPPSEFMLLNETSKNFKDFRKSGILIKGELVGEFGQNAFKALNSEGFLQLDAPSTYESVTRLANPPANSALSATAFHTARKRLARVARRTSEGKPTEDAAAATLVLRGLDNFFGRLPDEGFVAGTPAQIAEARASFAKGKGNYAAAMRSRTVSRLENNAELNTASANSGANLDNAYRQQFKTVLKDPKKQRGFSPEELTQMNTAVEGGPWQNRLRTASNLLGGGGGLGAAAYAIPSMIGGALTGNPYVMAAGMAPILGAGLKAGENALASRNIGLLGEMVRSRSPLAESGGRFQGAPIPTGRHSAPLRGAPALTPEEQMALEQYFLAHQNSL